jgi:tRNA nucleotidyltransferase (CCA-adding enzyme)
VTHELPAPPRDAVDPAAIPVAVIDLCRTLVDRGHGAWVVGGCVRDHLLGRAVNDWDVCTTARPKEILKYFPKAIPTGIEHGTVTVVRDGQHYEVTTLRGEGAYTDGRRPDRVYFLDDVREDLARRDFTVNAMAYDPLGQVLVDPFGGLRDLGVRVLRAVGDPVQRFNEDGLRILRGARFAATLEFELDAATEAAMELAIPVFQKVSAERVRDEWMKTMKARRPSRAFEVMLRRGILACVAPELVACVGVAQGPTHAHDVWEHSLRTLDATPKDAVLRIAALVHDIGKTKTEAEGFAFAHHERIGAEMADAWMRQWRFSNDERARVTHAVRHHQVNYDPSWSDASVRRFVQRVGVSALDDVFTLARADAEASGVDVEGRLGQLDALAVRVRGVRESGAALSAKELALDGTVLMKELAMKPSRALGEVLAALLERVLDDPAVNTREGLLTVARELLAARGEAATLRS